MGNQAASTTNYISPNERQAAGKALRDRPWRKPYSAYRIPRSSHSEWKPLKDRPDPVALIKTSSKGRLPNLIPIRYERMSKSPFAFLRGSAIVIASDLATTPTTGISSYLGKNDSFDNAIANFATLYANQVERDYQAFVAIVTSDQ